jgi:hypothetical protein
MFEIANQTVRRMPPTPRGRPGTSAGWVERLKRVGSLLGLGRTSGTDGKDRMLDGGPID